MTRMQALKCIVALLLLVPMAVSAQEPAPQPAAARIDAVLAASGFRGDVALRAPDMAYRHRDPRADSRDGGLWRWASVTKQIVAVLVMQEVAAGRIDLDAPVATYLPRFESANARVATVRQLLRHQAGLPNPDDTAPTPDAFPAYYLPGYAGSRDPLTGYCAGPPKSAPGGNWSYNNCDYIVVGALLEAVTGKSWARLVKERIAHPLRLKTVGSYPTRHRTRPGFYAGKAEPPIDFASYGASAGLYGSLEDLLTIDLALIDGTLLPKPQRDAMWDGQPGLGFIALGQWVFDARLKGCAAPVKIVERRGAIGGVEIRNFILPDRHLALVVFTDHSPFAFGEIWQGTGFSHDLLAAAVCS